MNRRATLVVVGLVAGLLATLAPTAASPHPTSSPQLKAGKYRPAQGPLFNNPYGTDDDRFRIERHIIKAIRNTPKTGHIRFALYSFDRIPVAKALIAARNRGVQVQVLLNGHQVTRAQRLLHRRLGMNPRKKNFAYECEFSCRGRRDFLHTKFYLFNKAGAADKVVMVGSANLTLNAVRWQWNDLYTVNQQEQLYEDFVELFNDMRHDYSRNRPFYLFCGKAKGVCHRRDEARVAQVFPKKVTAGDDPVLDLLNDVRCVYETPGGTARTMVRLSMHTMQGDRGEYIAAKVRELWANGCDIKVLYGLMGFHVKQVMGAITPRGRIPLRSLGYDYNDDGEVDRYTHQKYVTISGRWAGKAASITFTGSSNWSSRGTYGDELMFSVRGPSNVAKWNSNWRFMWDRHSRDAYTTTASEWRIVVPTIDSNGMLTTKVVTKRLEVTRVLPDHLRAGENFEKD